MLLAFEILLDREDMVNGPLSHGPQPTGVSWGGKQFLHVPSFCFPLRSVSFCLGAASGFRSMPDPQWKTESASILTCPRATLNKQGAGVAQIPEPLQGLCSIYRVSVKGSLVELSSVVVHGGNLPTNAPLSPPCPSLSLPWFLGVTLKQATCIWVLVSLYLWGGGWGRVGGNQPFFFWHCELD